MSFHFVFAVNYVHDKNALYGIQTNRELSILLLNTQAHYKAEVGFL